MSRTIRQHLQLRQAEVESGSDRTTSGQPLVKGPAELDCIPIIDGLAHRDHVINMPRQGLGQPYGGTGINNDTLNSFPGLFEKPGQAIRRDEMGIAILVLSHKTIARPSAMAGEMNNPRLYLEH